MGGEEEGGGERDRSDHARKLGSSRLGRGRKCPSLSAPV